MRWIKDVILASYNEAGHKPLFSNNLNVHVFSLECTRRISGQTFPHPDRKIYLHDESDNILEIDRL